MKRTEPFAFRDIVRQRFPRLFLLVLLITAVAKGGAFLPAYSIDDYMLVLQEKTPLESTLMQGRFGQALLIQLLHLIQLEPRFARLFFVAFALAVSSLLAVLVARSWHLGARGWLPLAVASTVSIYPFTTEIFTFRTALGPSMIAFALFAVLLWPRRWSLAGVLGGAAVFALALSIYQIVLNYCLMIVLCGTAIGLTRVLRVGSASGWPERVTSLLSLRRIPRNKNFVLLACAVLGTVLYTLVNAAVSWVSQVPLGGRAALLAPARIGARAAQVREVLIYRFLEPSPLLGQFPKGLLLLLLAAALAGLVVRARPWLRPRPALLLLLVAALIAVSLVWTVGIILVLEDFWPVPRVMSHTAIFWAGVLAIACLCASARVRQALGFLALLLVLSFIGSDNQILGDQIRLNIRDRAKADRILARLEAIPGFTGTETVAVHGGSWSYPLAIRTCDHDMNSSAYVADWSKVAILREVSGYDLRVGESDAEKAAAAAYCGRARPWPSPEAVTVQNGLVILCLEPE